MKKSFTMVLCFAFVACVLAGCGRTENTKTTDTTTTPSISAAPTTTHTIAPTIESTQPSTTNGMENIPEASLPNNENNRAESNSEPEIPRTRTHYPSVIEKTR